MELETRAAAHLRREARHNLEARIKFSDSLMMDYSERCLFFSGRLLELAKKEFGFHYKRARKRREKSNCLSLTLFHTLSGSSPVFRSSTAPATASA